MWSSMLVWVVSAVLPLAYRDRDHPAGIVVATGLKRAKKLVSMLLFDFMQWIFPAEDLVNEDKDLLLCVFMEGKVLH